MRGLLLALALAFPMEVASGEGPERGEIETIKLFCRSVSSASYQPRPVCVAKAREWLELKRQHAHDPRRSYVITQCLFDSMTRRPSGLVPDLTLALSCSRRGLAATAAAMPGPPDLAPRLEIGRTHEGRPGRDPPSMAGGSSGKGP